MGKSNGITIDVYEGEDDDVRNNVWYGHYEFPCGPGEEVDVIFKFNKFGILAVRDWRCALRCMRVALTLGASDPGGGT